MRNIPILTIFLSFLLLAACGESAKKKEKKTDEEIIETDLPQENEEEKTILFFGTSLTAGLGLEPAQAYPAVIQRKLDSLQLDYDVVNAGLSGETTASGKNRLNWVLNQKVDVFVLELGANDGLRGVPLEETRKNLREIIEEVRKKNPDTRIILAGMQIPPNMGAEYTTEFRNIFPELAKEYDLELIPFLLEDVAGIPGLNQQDGIHPTAEGQKIIAENVWEVLEPKLPE
ncbi:arylesterase [Salegentibacter sediminis]|uniref:arylesterase n=1 Tax=Salegentibacter sediminis TaxID=1930251 RepID=UPI0009BC9948|nr:arylesterase [Salegentibacter sediminis]